MIEPVQPKRASFDLDLKSNPAGGWAGWRGPLAATGLAALLRLPFLGQPHAVIFDETYYVKDSLALLNFGHERKVIENADAALLASGGENVQSIFTDAASPNGKLVSGKKF